MRNEAPWQIFCTDAAGVERKASIYMPGNAYTLKNTETGQKAETVATSRGGLAGLRKLQGLWNTLSVLG